MTEWSRNPQPKKQYFILGLIFTGVLFLIVTLSIGLKQNPKELASHFSDKPALPFKASWIQGQDLLDQPSDENIRLEDFRGKNVVLNFWASWCVSCRTEAIDLEAFHQTTQLEQPNTIVVGIAIQDTREAATRFAEHYGKTYILGLDDDGKISIDYGVTGVPETVFINAEGVIKHKHVGPLDQKMLLELTSKYF